MKISTRNLMRAVRLYGLADDNTPLKAIRRLQIHDGESFVRAEFVLDKQKYALLYGSGIDEDALDEFWPHHPASIELLPNPLDPDTHEMPFQGKFVILMRVPSETQRLDQFLSNQFDPSLSRSQWQKHIRAGHVRVNDQVVTAPRHDVSDTDDISVNFPEVEQETLTLPIIYEDSDVIVINKPAGILTHAKGGITLEQTVADAVRHATTFAADTDRPGIIHRLDRDTSGVIIVAKSPEAATLLQQQFATRRAQKTYLAIIDDIPQHTKATIDLPIGRHPQKPSTFRVDPNGKSAETRYEVLATDGRRALVKLQPKTGRTHQLRVHMSHLNAPISGDRVYGRAGERLMLHAYQLTIQLPSGDTKTFTAPIPPEFLADFPTITPDEL